MTQENNEDLFGKTEVPKEENTPSFNLSDYVGEDKKYKTEEDFIKSRLEADSYIERLQNENKGIREDMNRLLNADQKLDELLDQIKNRELNNNDNAGNSENHNQNGSESDKEIDLKLVEELVEKKLQSKQQELTTQNNLAESERAMKDFWGDNAQVELNKRSQETGLSLEFLKQLASTQPSAFKKLVGLEKKSNEDYNSNDKPNSSVDTTKAGFNSNNSNTKNYAYYEEMRKNNPKEYWKPYVQNEMFTNANQMGENFYN